MSSTTVGPRLELDPEHYPRLRVWDPDCGHDRYLYLHRLVAYAHGELDDVFDDDRHVHHRNRDRWDNRPSNLEATAPDRHCSIHLG